MKQISEIRGKPNLHVCHVNFEVWPFYAVVYDDANSNCEEEYEIPDQLAYFLYTHWAGTPQMRNNIKAEFQNEVKAVLGIRD